MHIRKTRKTMVFQAIYSYNNGHTQLHSHLSTIMVAIPLRVLRYKSAMQSEIRSLLKRFGNGSKAV